MNLLLSDEQNLTRHLSVIVSSLETLTDTELEYSTVTFLHNNIEIMLIDLEMQVNCILAQKLNAFMIPDCKASSIQLASLRAAQLSGRIAKDGYTVVIRLVGSTDIFTKRLYDHCLYHCREICGEDYPLRIM
jgi:hypothetical protein